MCRSDGAKWTGLAQQKAAVAGNLLKAVVTVFLTDKHLSEP